VPAQDSAEPLRGKARWYPLVFLLLLAATLAEFLTGSTPVLRGLTNPIGLASLVGLYGGGALLIRETALRWGKRWGAMLLLGGAYAVGEEGFGAKTMVDPTGSNIGNQLYTHWMGVNWVPLASLTLFHSVFSIGVPILLVELLIPEVKGRRLVGDRGFGVTMVLYALTIIFLSLADPYVIPLPVDAFLAVYAGAFIVAAYLVPKSFLRATTEHPDRRERAFFVLGLGFLGSFFLIFLFGALFLQWPVMAALYVPIAILVGTYLVRHAGSSGNEVVKVDFVLGMMVVFVIMDIILELEGDTGVLVYTALILALLVILRHRWKLVLDKGRSGPAGASEGEAARGSDPSIESVGRD
jgi:hypothetical protein